MTYTTQVRKSYNGWQAETLIDLNQGNGQTLIISTYKDFTDASVYFVADNGNRSTIIFEDYSEYKRHPVKLRSTEKNITNAHKLALLDVQTHLDAVELQYNINGGV